MCPPIAGARRTPKLRQWPGEHMKPSRNHIVAALLSLSIAGCASENWAPGPDARGTVQEATARCDLMARHPGGGFIAAGSPRFVAGAAAGYAVGSAISAYLDYNDCMMANGWVPAKAPNTRAAYNDAPAAIVPAAASVPEEAPAPPAHCTKDDLANAELAKKQGYQYNLACTP